MYLWYVFVFNNWDQIQTERKNSTVTCIAEMQNLNLILLKVFLR